MASCACPGNSAALRIGAMIAVSAPETVVDVGAVAVIDGPRLQSASSLWACVLRIRPRAQKPVSCDRGLATAITSALPRTSPAGSARQVCVGVTTKPSPRYGAVGGRVKTVGPTRGRYRRSPWAIRRGACWTIANTAVARGKSTSPGSAARPCPTGGHRRPGRPTNRTGGTSSAGLILPCKPQGYAIRSDGRFVRRTDLEPLRHRVLALQPDQPRGVGHLVIALRASSLRTD